MYGNQKKNLCSINEEKKVSAKGLKNIFLTIGRKIFGKTYKNEVAYGLTLSKKRRKNCVLKSVTSLSYAGEDEFLLPSSYRINFNFSKEECRSFTKNFRETGLQDSFCQKCCYNLSHRDSVSLFSTSSDSACELSSQSSCDDLKCIYRKPAESTKDKRRRSPGDVSSKIKGRTVENFIRLHQENFQDGLYDSIRSAKKKNFESVDDSDYDILLTKPGYRIVEPSYENLKVVVENLYETLDQGTFSKVVLKDEDEGIRSNNNYDEVIESLKLWHLRQKNPFEGERAENKANHCLETYLNDDEKECFD